MRLWIVIIALAGFVPQLFVCCAQDCGACTDPAMTDDKHQCHHHEDGEDEPAGSSHDDHSHHLCVATHLFYVVRAHDDAPQPDLNSLEAVPSMAVVAADATLIVAQCKNHSFSLSPPTALQLRAELGVWTI